jgi:hypothetical protein
MSVIEKLWDFDTGFLRSCSNLVIRLWWEALDFGVIRVVADVGISS